MQNKKQIEENASTFLISLPVRNENIGISCTPVVAVAAEDDLLSIACEHGKCVESFVAADFFNGRTISIHRVHIERKATLVFVIAAKDDPAIRKEIRRPVGLAQGR